MLKALNRVKDVSEKMNALSGFHVIPPDVEAFQEKVREGYKFIAHSLDILFFGEQCRNFLKAIRKSIDVA
jgi:2-dehydro-3-deoxyglucarate aldolase